MKASEVISYLQKAMEISGIDPEISLVIEPYVDERKIQFEDDLESTVTVTKSIEGVLDLKSTRIVFAGKSFYQK